jgi:hypothetical protein
MEIIMSEFEKKLYIDDEGCPTEGAVLKRHWHQHKDRINSLESHNRELLAVNQVLREALQKACADVDELSVNSTNEDYIHGFQIGVTQSLKIIRAIKPGDVTLVEVGSVDCQFVDGIGEHHVAEFCHLPEGVTKLYVLQKKEGANVST